MFITFYVQRKHVFYRGNFLLQVYYRETFAKLLVENFCCSSLSIYNRDLAKCMDDDSEY